MLTPTLRRSLLVVTTIVIGCEPLIGMREAQVGAPLKIYMRATGSNANSGLSETEAVKDLWRVDDILLAMGFNDTNCFDSNGCWALNQNRNVEVHISAAKGKYYGQGNLIWESNNPNYYLTFMRLNDTRPRPVFNGCSHPYGYCLRHFFWRSNATGRANIGWNSIQIEQYDDGITFSGSRNNTVYNCLFFQIGAEYTDTSTGGGNGGVSLQNADSNLVQGNQFIEFGSASSLHAIYISHDADRNLVIENKFGEHKGDPVRVRDRSDYNRILGNHFVQATQGGNHAAYSEWVGSGEGVSCENEFRDNLLDGRYDCDSQMRVYSYLENYSTQVTCSAGYRLRTSGNAKTSAPYCRTL